MFYIPSVKASLASLKNMTLRITDSNGSILTLDDLFDFMTIIPITQVRYYQLNLVVMVL